MLQPSKIQQQWLFDIIENIDRLRGHVDGKDADSFERDDMVRDAVERCLQRITEAVIRLGEDANELMPRQDVKGIRGLGNFLRHKYDRVEAHLIWEYIESDIPALRQAAFEAASRYDGIER